jgi:hypothetical protein
MYILEEYKYKRVHEQICHFYTHIIHAIFLFMLMPLKSVPFHVSMDFSELYLNQNAREFMNRICHFYTHNSCNILVHANAFKGVPFHVFVGFP